MERLHLVLGYEWIIFMSVAAVVIDWLLLALCAKLQMDQNTQKAFHLHWNKMAVLYIK